MRSSDWSSDVCSSDLAWVHPRRSFAGIARVLVRLGIARVLEVANPRPADAGLRAREPGIGAQRLVEVADSAGPVAVLVARLQAVQALEVRALGCRVVGRRRPPGPGPLPAAADGPPAGQTPPAP